MSGIVNVVGETQSGVIGTAVLDCDADSFEFIIHASNDYSSDSEIYFGWDSRVGRNIGRSGNYFTAANPGWYYINCKATHQAQYDRDLHLKLRISDPAGSPGNSTYVNQVGRLYTGDTNDGMSYWGHSMIWIVPLRATDKFGMYGTGYLYGNTTNSATRENAMNKLMGFRLGA